jgi:signal peptidase I
LSEAVRETSDASVLADRIAELESVFATSYPTRARRAHTFLREPLDLLLVPVIVALGVRTFFVQPFSIPTGSMQPTLYGITVQDPREDPATEIPPWHERIAARCLRGASYYQILAQTDGRLEEEQAPPRSTPFARYRFRIGSTWYSVPATLQPFLPWRAGGASQDYRRGDHILALRLLRGDHILVDRLTYNFRAPRRGEIVVFGTRDVPGLPPDQYYVKRLVGLPGERIQIGDDRHLVVNGRRLDAATPGFTRLYAAGTSPLAYLGHLNQHVAQRAGLANPQELAPLFPDENASVVVRPRHLLLMGDNTLFSLDSRAWGDLPIENLRGRAWLVYWPLSPRLGRTAP